MLFVLAATIPVLSPNLIQDESLKEIISTQKTINKNPSIVFSTIFYGKTKIASEKNSTKVITFVKATILLKNDFVEDVEFARQIATTLTSKFSKAQQKDVVQINLFHGYDIGIASKWERQSHNFNPVEFVRRQ